jgi:hypothetical protein
MHGKNGLYAVSCRHLQQESQNMVYNEKEKENKRTETETNGTKSKPKLKKAKKEKKLESSIYFLTALANS